MTNEELTVLARMADELIDNRRFQSDQHEICERSYERASSAEKEVKRLIDECNRLRESEANALNAAEEAKRERDEASKKLGEWVRFVNDSIYPALDKATKLKNCRNVVKVSVKAMRKFIFEHPVEVIEGGMAK